MEDHIVTLFHYIYQLKSTHRKGWEQRGIPNPESLGDHTTGVSLLALYYAKKLGLNREKALATALIHDLCEAKTGDITPLDGISPEEKKRREQMGIREILEPIDTQGELLSLWEEFEEGNTPEGRLVRELDRLEMALQARVYEREHSVDLEEFFSFVENQLTIPELKNVFHIISEGRIPKRKDT